MIYLLAKYALVFILATFAGFILGRWVTRRSFVDVTESYETLRNAAGKTDAAQWDKLWRRFDSIPEPKETNLGVVTERLDGLAYAIAKLPVPLPVNLASVEGRLGAVSKVVDGLSTRADLSSLSAKLDEVDAVVRRVPQQGVDLDPFDQRLREIESALKDLSKAPIEISRSRTSLASAPSAGPAILKEAAFGKKDNLRLISGIGPKLERLLNTNGVFYFWQIANWTDSDIELIDERLDTFKGRIGRDEWVSQANRFRRKPDSAQQPTEMRISA